MTDTTLAAIASRFVRDSVHRRSWTLWHADTMRCWCCMPSRAEAEEWGRRVLSRREYAHVPLLLLLSPDGTPVGTVRGRA